MRIIGEWHGKNLQCTGLEAHWFPVRSTLAAYSGSHWPRLRIVTGKPNCVPLVIKLDAHWFPVKVSLAENNRVHWPSPLQPSGLARQVVNRADCPPLSVHCQLYSGRAFAYSPWQ